MKRIIIFAMILISIFSLSGCQKHTKEDKKEKHVHVNPVIVLPHPTTDDAIHSIDEPSESVHVEPTEPVHVEPAIR